MNSAVNFYWDAGAIDVNTPGIGGGVVGNVNPPDSFSYNFTVPANALADTTYTITVIDWTVVQGSNNSTPSITLTAPFTVT